MDVVLGVLELRTPEQSVERADLHTDPAIHAQGVVDGEPVQNLDAPRSPARRRLVRLLVGVDVDAPVRALARALVADRAVLLLQRDDASRPGRKVGLLVR